MKAKTSSFNRHIPIEKKNEAAAEYALVIKNNEKADEKYNISEWKI